MSNLLVPSDVHSFIPVIMRALRKIVRPGEIEDATSEVMVRLLEDFGSLRGAENPKGWVYGVAKRVGWEISRNKSRRTISADRKDTEEGQSIAEKLVDNAPLVEEVLGEKERESALGKAMARLSAEERLVIVLAYIDELEGPEASKAMGIKPCAFRQRLNRARKSLRVEMERRVER